MAVRRSIYRLLDPPANEDDVRQWSTRHDPHQASRDSPATSESAVDWSLARKKIPVNYMLPITTRWLEALPQEVRPMALVAKYPRIANILTLVWNNPVECRAYFDELIIDHRGKRRGFPEDVHRDLVHLRDHYGRLDLQLIR